MSTCERVGGLVSDVAWGGPAGVFGGLFSEAEWLGFECAVRRWLGEGSGRSGQVRGLDGALVWPSAYTYAVTVKEWMERLGFVGLAERICPADYADADVLSVGEGV